ncbi:MAG: hypothetical protein ACRD3A_07915 [Terriglobales bacterium]
MALIAAGVLLGLAAVWLVLHRTSRPASPATPQFGWRTLDTAKFELHRVEARVYPLGHSVQGRVKLMVTASAPVSFGFGSERRVRALNPIELAAKKDRGEAAITALHCSRFNVVGGDAECEVKQPRGDLAIFVNDERKAAQAAGDPEAAKKAAANNQVAFALSEWACIANCP